MCTVTFVAQRNGYCLGMNRDEKLTRATGRPPTSKRVNGHTVIFPSEPAGGTWIALNDAGVCFALINWYSVNDRVKHQPISRGEVVRILSGNISSGTADRTLRAFALEKVNPFRLIGVFPGDGAIVEWRWNLKQLSCQPLPWKTQQWISSGFDEGAAQKVRDTTFRRSLAESSGHGLRWLRKLHQSHTPAPGPFSICVHRPDAETVSFTEIAVNSRTLVMRYIAGCPCGRHTKSVPSTSSYKMLRAKPMREDQHS